MILDDLKNYRYYSNLSQNFKTAFEWMTSVDLNSLAPKRYEIDGNNVYANIQQYETLEPEELFFEAHRVYADIQIVIFGEEIIQWAPLSTAKLNGDYSVTNDLQKLIVEKKNSLHLNGNNFAIFFPYDAHMPRVAYKVKGPVIKIVIKVKVADL